MSREENAERLNTLKKMYTLRGASPSESMKSTASAPATLVAEPQLDEPMQEFVDYVRTLGGHSSGLDEKAVTQMFMGGIYTQRLPTEPLKIVEMERVPAGLQRARTLVRNPEYIPWSRVQTAKRGNFERPKYGAWYLPPTEWKVDKEKPPPSLVPENPELLRRSDVLRDELSRLQGARLFREYLLQQHAHIPKFLEVDTAPPRPAARRNQRRPATSG